MYQYSNLKITSQVAENFRKYTKIIGKKHSETLQLFLDFFEKNNVQPTDEISGSLKSVENKILQRIDALIKIIRGIEKEELKRSGAIKEMLYELTLQHTELSTPQLPKNLGESTLSFKDTSEHAGYQNQVQKTAEELLLFFDNIEKVNPNFGNAFYKINTQQHEITKFKRMLKDLLCI